MPSRDIEERRAAGRRHYAAHREEVIAKVKAYRLRCCVGVCKVCGGPTHGDRPSKIPEYCAKPACASAARRHRPTVEPDA